MLIWQIQISVVRDTFFVTLTYFAWDIYYLWINKCLSLWTKKRSKLIVLFLSCISVCGVCRYQSRRDRGSFNVLINLQFSLDFAMTSLPRIRWLWKMAAKSCEPWRGHFGWEKRSWTFSDLAVRKLLFSWQTKALIKDDVCTLRGAILTFKPRNRQVFHGDRCGSEEFESEIYRDCSCGNFTSFCSWTWNQTEEMKDIIFLEGILAAVASQDTQKRLKAAEDFSNYLSDPSNGIEFIGFDKLLDGLIGWVNSSNFKASRRWKHKLLSCRREFVLLHYRLRKSVASFGSVYLNYFFDLARCRVVCMYCPENILYTTVS